MSRRMQRRTLLCPTGKLLFRISMLRAVTHATVRMPLKRIEHADLDELNDGYEGNGVGENAWNIK